MKAEGRINAMGCWALQITKDVNGKDVSKEWRIVKTVSFDVPNGARKLYAWATKMGCEVTNFRNGIVEL